tara:strand:+ start:600 stop:1217 length:618 start_codon:yes stop_codon:yes gene_type:complete
MTATKKTYTEAHDLMATLGRRYRKSTSTYGLTKLFDSGEVLGCKTVSVTEISYSKKKTLRKFLQANPSGRFFCLMRSHAFAAVDGKLIDTWRVPAGSRIFRAWQVLQPGEKLAVKPKSVSKPKPPKKKRKKGQPAVRRARAKRILVHQLAILPLPKTVSELARLVNLQLNDYSDQVWRDVSWLVHNDSDFVQVYGYTHRKHYVIR